MSKPAKPKFKRNSDRNTKKLLLILTLLLIVLFISSCSSQSSTSSLTKNYKTGYQGLVITTLANYPPDTVYPASDFQITVKLDNQGAYKVTNGKIEIIGFDTKYVELTQPKKEIVSLTEDTYLEGKSHTNPFGEFSYLEFKTRTKNLFPGSEIYNAPYFIKAEYDYQTELTQTVCLNPNLYDTSDAGCKVQFKTSLSGQGSPLAITGIEEVIHSGAIPQVEFRFDIKNQGKGKIKTATLKKAKLGKDDLICEFRNNPGINKKVFDFKDKQEATLICKKVISGQTSYQTTLLLDFAFGYSLEEKKKITIKK